MSREILWLVDPEVRVAPPAGADRLPVGQLLDAVRRRLPAAYVSSLEMGEDYFAVEMDAALPGGKEISIWVDPYSGRVQGTSAKPTLVEFLAALHGWLLTSWAAGTAIGWYAVTALSVPLLGSLVTGVVVHKRFWRSLIAPRVRLRRGLRAFLGDFHRLAGVWTLWFLLIIGLSGAWFLCTGVLYDAHVPLKPGTPAIARDAVPLVAPGAPVPKSDIDAALAAVGRLHPGFSPVHIGLPDHAFAPLAVRSRAIFSLIAREDWVNPYTGESLAAPGEPRTALLRALSEFAGSLHFGDFGGLAVRMVWFFCGLAMTGLVASGMLIWTKRVAPAAGPVDRDGGAWRQRLAAAGRHAKAHAGILVLAIPLSAMGTYLHEDGRATAMHRALADRQLGDWPVAVAEIVPPTNDGRRRARDYAVRFPGGYPSRLRAAYLTFGEPVGRAEAGTVLRGGPDGLQGHVAIPPADAGKALELWLTAEEWDGTIHQAFWRLDD